MKTFSKVHESSEDEPDLDQALSIAQNAARSAGAIVLQMRGEGLSIESKNEEESNIVTQADKASEQLISEAIHQQFPNHSIRGEEGTTSRNNENEYEWIIDPIDGTLNFSQGKPFSISIGLTYKGTPVLGVLYFPDDDVTLSAIAGNGAFLNGKKLERREEIPLSKARIGFDVSSGGNQHSEEKLYRKPLKGIVASTDRIYCATFAARRIIEGTLDAYVCGGGLTPYDLGAMTVILREAGCTAEGMEGGIDFSQEKIPFIATTGHALQEAMKKILPTRQRQSFFHRLACEYLKKMRLLFGESI